MCVVSAIYDYGRNRPMTEWDHKQLEEFKRLVEKAMEFDKITGQPDCEDPEKKRWVEIVEENLNK